MRVQVTAIVVSFADPHACLRAIQSLLAQTHVPAEVLVLDNDPAAATASLLAGGTELAGVRVLHTGANIGYVRAVNLAAAEARGEWLFCLNPDAVAAPDCLELLLAAVDGVDVGIVGAQVLLPDGRINAGDNPINIAGFSWSGGYGQPREHAPARDTAAVSGAALMARRAAFLRAGGLCPDFFMYVDDTDLAWRMRMEGWRVRYCPGATVIHDYEFHKGAHKWFYLERNRTWALVGNLELFTLALLFPMLVIVELAVLVRAISEGWLAQKARAWLSLLAHAPRIIRWRRHVQGSRNVSDYRVLCLFRGGIETSLIDDSLPGFANRGLELYRRIVLALLRRRSGKSRVAG